MRNRECYNKKSSSLPFERLVKGSENPMVAQGNLIRQSDVYTKKMPLGLNQIQVTQSFPSSVLIRLLRDGPD